jgi:hypothetical protein
MTLIKNIKDLLTKREFITVASTSHDGKPNAAPKFLLKIDDTYIYLVDYIIGRTYTNLKSNPVASLSVMDTDSLTGYQINGSVELIESGPLHDQLLREFRDRALNISIERVIEAVQSGKKHKSFEAAFPEHCVILKVKMEELVGISATGNLEHQSLRGLQAEG